MSGFDTIASQEAKRLGINHTTLIAAIRSGACPGEQRDGKWYTSTVAAADWYREHYRHAKSLYSHAAGKTWSLQDAETLREMIESGATMAEIAATLKRSIAAVRTQASKRHLSAPVGRKEPPQVVEEAPVYGNERRKMEHEGRLRLHVHPEVKKLFFKELERINASLPDDGRLTLARWVTGAGLAAISDPQIIEKGLRLAQKLGKGELLSPKGVD